MKIVFVVPASDFRRAWYYRVGNKIYGQPDLITGPLILGGILKNAGHQVEVYQELYQDYDYAAMSDADIVGIYTMTSNTQRAYLLADQFRHMGKRVIIGGMHATVMPGEALAHCDQVVRGEAENVIIDLIEGRITDKIVDAPPVADLDQVPFPDYSVSKTPCKVANLLTSRGCPYSCSFCTTSRMFHPYRRRSADNVIKELRLYKDLGFEYVNFEDDNFTADKNRAKEILRRMIREKLVFKETFFFGRTDLAKDEELLGLLRDAHLRRVLIGIESLNQQTLDSINKHQHIEDIIKCAGILSKYKIKMIASLVLGIDNDSVEDIRKAVDFCREIDAYQLQPAILTPFPGTPLFEQYLREGRILTKDWQNFDMMHVTFRPSKMSPWQLQEEFFRALQKFYTFGSALRTFKLFGIDAGLRRVGLWRVVRLGTFLMKGMSHMTNGNYFNRLRESS